MVCHEFIMSLAGVWQKSHRFETTPKGTKALDFEVQVTWVEVQVIQGPDYNDITPNGTQNLYQFQFFRNDIPFCDG